MNAQSFGSEASTQADAYNVIDTNSNGVKTSKVKIKSHGLSSGSVAALIPGNVLESETNNSPQ